MFRLALSIFLLCCTPLHALTLPVLSGEHRGFTRLVVELPPGTPWKLGRIEGGYGLRVDLPGLVLNTERVFQRIPTTRLASLHQDGQGDILRLTLNCNCHATLTPGHAGLVIIDLRDGPARPGALTEALLESPASLPAMSLVKTTGPSLPAVPYQPPDDLSETLREGLMKDMARSIAAGSLRAVAAIPPPPKNQLLPAGPVILPQSVEADAPDQILFHGAPPRRLRRSPGHGDPLR